MSLQHETDFDAWYLDPNRSGSTFGYQDTREGIMATIRAQAKLAFEAGRKSRATSGAASGEVGQLIAAAIFAVTGCRDITNGPLSLTAQLIEALAKPAEQSAPPVPPMDQSSCIPPSRAEPASQLEAAHRLISSHIKLGPLQGNGCDATAQRNGLILAANMISNMIEEAEKSAPPVPRMGGITIKTWEERIDPRKVAHFGKAAMTRFCQDLMLDEIAELRAVLATQSASTAPGQADTEREVKHGCHCDLEPHMEPDDCVIGTSRQDDCVYAKRQSTKEQCIYWQPIAALSKEKPE